jgi:membrane-associated protease RseP (regulator of RpoE activity)
MFRNTLLAALAAVSLVTWDARQSLAQERPRTGLERSGFLVTQVRQGSTADQQGLKEGDVIVKVDGKAVRTTADLDRCLGRVGYVAQLEIIDGNTRELNRVAVYPSAGRIGVAGEPVAVVNIAPEKPPVRPIQLPQPIQPWNAGMYPLPIYPWNPGLYPPVNPWNPGLYPPVNPWNPGMHILPGNPWNHGIRPWNPGGQPIPLPLPIPGGIPGIFDLP